MDELRELYQQVILDHNKNPRNFKTLQHVDKKAEGYNPLCGDHYTISLSMKNDIIEDIAVEGSGCAISKASASMMSNAVKGMTKKEAEELFEKFRSLVTRNISLEEDIENLGCLGALAGVAEFPARIKCASLPWHTLHSALSSQNSEVVSTE